MTLPQAVYVTPKLQGALFADQKRKNGIYDPQS
jgi:hypothetical protein